MIEQIYSRTETLTRLRTGPLGSHIDGFAARLLEQGYSAGTIREKIRAAGILGQWMSRQQQDLAALDEQRILEFQEQCRRDRRLTDIRSAVFSQLLSNLRELGVVSAARPRPDSRQPIERIYAEYLVSERGIAAPTIRHNLLIAHRFLAERFGAHAFDCSQLCAADVTQFMLRHLDAYKLRSARTMLASLRVFLRFLYMQGETAGDLSGCVFRVADWRLSELPRFLEPQEVEHLLRSVDQTARSGLRDYAILLLLARLGLRGGEVINLKLEDIDWAAGTITVRGKSMRHNGLPSAQDVGEAIVNYLRDGRPKCSCRRLFVRAMAPYGPLHSSSAITSLVKRHLARARLNPSKRGAHVLRHSLATRMIRGGNTLDEIADILGHQFHTSTEIYAKVAVEPLRRLAQP